MQPPIDVSVVIVNWNTIDYLRECLVSLFATTRDVSFEVIVVDNGSHDGSVELVRSHFPQVRLLTNSENMGYPVANNQGIAVSQGRYMLLLNSDVIVFEGAISRLAAFLDAHPMAGAVGGTMIRRDRTVDPLCFRRRFDALTIWTEYLFLNRLLPSAYEATTAPREVDVLIGAYMMVRREAIAQVGGLDERFFLSAEDVDWCLRIRQAGWKIFYYPPATIIHYGSESFKRSWDRGIITSYHSKELMFEKHYGPISMLALRGAALIGSLLRLAGWAGRAAVRRQKARTDALTRACAYWQVVKQTLRLQTFETSCRLMRRDSYA